MREARRERVQPQVDEKGWEGEGKEGKSEDNVGDKAIKRREEKSEETDRTVGRGNRRGGRGRR